MVDANDGPRLPLWDLQQMALSAVHQWARAITIQIERIESCRYPARERTDLDLCATEQHFFVIACAQLLKSIKWLKSYQLFEEKIFNDFVAKEKTITQIRNYHEHADEYYQGIGNFRKEWHREGPDIEELKSIPGQGRGTTSPMGAINTTIGGVLDWREIGPMAASILTALPRYLP